MTDGGVRGPPRPTVLWSWCGRADVGIGPYEKDEAIAWGGDAQLCPAGGAVIWRGNMRFLPGRKRERTSRPFSFISCASAGAAPPGRYHLFSTFSAKPGKSSTRSTVPSSRVAVPVKRPKTWCWSLFSSLMSVQAARSSTGVKAMSKRPSSEVKVQGARKSSRPSLWGMWKVTWLSLWALPP